MLRIHFTAADLARTTLAAETHPLWEVVLSSFRLRDRDRPRAFRQWARTLRPEVRSAARLLEALTPAGPYFPDFLTPAEGARGLEAGLDAILRTPKPRLTEELRLLHALSPLPDRLAPLTRGDTGALAELVRTLRAYHAAAIAPHEDVIRASVNADRVRRAHDLLDGGVDGLLDGLRPLARWHPPLLEVDYAVDRDLRLDGRGLVLVPSYFCRGRPVAPADPTLAPVLVYPIDPTHRWSAAPRPDALAALLGPTRAATLQAIGGGANTTELAQRVGTSPASTSRHTQVLREAGLISSTRHGSAVLHALTPLGAALLGQRTTR
ncbi:ArsR/SmtB family transcription factor [Saccharothrix coeruleofusca]|uniref:Transcriptional regulator n=1 Tax=Saccharothrix coeruleofusca TaxID=33919 RepID=A0A918EJ44_9PSEU|nr:helix-turn-helix domain-containing protein [Saccharothrix coeruleofusca]GGP88185.1 transcriptional regulator [Saccharothrix coeruleofusca]